MVAAGAAYLFGDSGPAFSQSAVFSFLVLALIAIVVWATFLLRVMISRFTPEVKHLAFAPFVIAVTVLLASANVSVRARFLLGRAEFQAVVDEFSAPKDHGAPARIDVPRTIGSYSISSAYQAGDDLAFFVDANFESFGVGGFAYLPNGPTDSKKYFQNNATGLSFESLMGDWYTFTGGS